MTNSTGSPFNGGDCGELAGITQGSRGDSTGIRPYLDNPTPQEYFRRASSGRGAATRACTVPDARGFNEMTYREGNIGRNSYIGPGVFGWDCSALKRFDLNLEFRHESFTFRIIRTGGRPTRT